MSDAGIILADDGTDTATVPAAIFGGPVACRDWVATQYRASYKGIGFEVAIDSREGGRRLVPHQYPSRESWDIEDLGKRLNAVRVRAFVHGDDAVNEAESLFEACSSYGAGALILPFVPPTQAHCISVTRSFVADELGRFFFDLEFLLKKPVQGQRIETSTQLASSVSGAASNALTLLQQQFDLRYNGVGLPSVARDAASTMLQQVAGAFGNAAAAIRMADATGALIRYEIGQLTTRSLDLAYSGQRADTMTPIAYFGDQVSADSGVSSVLISIIKKIGDAGIVSPETAIDATEAMLTIAQFAATVVVDLSMSRSAISERFLTDLIAGFVRTLGLCQAARAAVIRSYRSRAEAIQMRSRIGNAFNAAIEATDNPDIAAALDKVRVAAVAYLTRSGAELPRVIRIRMKTFRPAAVIANLAYGDATRDREIVERNGAPHPLFCFGDVEVLAP